MARYNIPLFELGLAMADAVDLMSPMLAGHHTRVAYIAARLAEELGLDASDIEDLVLAALLHDVGAFSSRQRLQILSLAEIEDDYHAELGALFLERFPTFDRVAQAVRHHHRPWRDGQQLGIDLDLANLLHLADRIDVLSYRTTCILSSVDEVVASVRRHSGRLFSSESVAALERLSRRDFVWLDLRSSHLSRTLRRMLAERILVLENSDMLEFALLLSHMVDFRSSYTSAHTAGVACCAAFLASEAGLDHERATEVQLAGYLHDLGKLAVPSEVLDKPAGLDPSEWSIMRTHVYHTLRILEGITGLGEVTEWASSHHEKLDGTGYPFRTTNLALETRLLAVADVFTAISENRPYRAGSSPDTVRDVLRRMVSCHHLDGDVVELALAHQLDLDEVRRAAQRPSHEAYRELMAKSAAITN